MSPYREEPVNSAAGYFPGQLKKTLNDGRWTIVRKLGWGSHSSTWLAVDSGNPDNIEAIKIYTVSATNNPMSTNERDILQKLRDSRIFSRVPVLRESFYEGGEDGRHLCLVLHPLGPSVASLLDSTTAEGKYLPLHVVKKVVGEVLEVLCSLHPQDIVHGAVTPDNILLPSYQQGLDIRDFLTKNPSQSDEGRSDTQGNVRPVVESQPLNTYELRRESSAADFGSVNLYLSNFSHARITSQDVILDTPRPSLPPEASVKGAKIDGKADIWMLGCTIYTLIVGRPPFEDAPGSLPPQKVEETIAQVQSDIMVTNAMSAEDAKETAELIRACLSSNPADRPSAFELLGYEWLESGMI